MSGGTEARSRGIKRVLWQILVLNVVVSAAKAIWGLVSGSTAMLADGIHSLTDASGNVVALVAMVAASNINIGATTTVTEAVNRGANLRMYGCGTSNNPREYLGQFLMSRLKAECLWLEAHAIWLALWRQPVDLLFNGDFEQTPVSQGFDWEWRQDDPGRAGAQIQLQGFGQRGQVLRVRLTGRPLEGPAVWQHILLPPGHYRLSGDYRSDHLRSEGGLVWVLRCADRDEEMARSPGLSSTGRQWQGFEMALTSDGRCLGAMLALQPAMALESRTGLRGEMLFDQLRLERVSAP